MALQLVARTFCIRNRQFALSAFSILVGAFWPAFVTSTLADVSHQFLDVASSPNAEFVWDDYNGASYAGPHTPDVLSAGTGSGSITVSPVPTPPGGIVAGNLYSFITVPNWQVDLSGLSTTEAFSSVVVQFATTADLTGGNLSASNFTLGGNIPDEFIDMGSPLTIPGNGGAPTPVNFYWAEWIGTPAAANYTVEITGAGGFHQVLAGTKVSHVNTSTPFNVSAAPEPTAAWTLGSLAIAGLSYRRRRRA